MTDRRALVGNAADEAQVRRAGRQEQDRDARLRSNLASSLQYPEVRYVFSELLERAGLYASVFDHSGSVMYWREGRRNFGLEMRAMLEAASETLTDQMDRERRDRIRCEDRATEDSHAARAEEASE